MGGHINSATARYLSGFLGPQFKFSVLMGLGTCCVWPGKSRDSRLGCEWCSGFKVEDFA